MCNAAKNITKETLSSFMVVGTIAQPDWKHAARHLAMATLMLAGGLLAMNLNPFNVSMHDRFEVKLAKQAAMMELGMGLGMLMFKLLRFSLSGCAQTASSTNEGTPATNNNASDYHALPQGAPV